MKLLLCCTLPMVSCQTTPKASVSPIQAQDWSQIEERVFNQQLRINEFSTSGPFKVTSFQMSLPISPKEKYDGDYFMPSHKGKSPLVIFVHGNHFNRHVHSQQAERLSSWGFHTLILDVPNEDEWVQNGKRIAKITKLIHSYPELLSERVNVDKILLAGHSFGGSAVTLAAAHGAPIKGLILLDPAVVHDVVIKAMSKVSVPVVLLGADPKFFKSRRRKLFFKHIPSPITEVTVTGSTHNDAQYPSMTSWRWGIDPFTTEKHQETFLQSIIVSAFGLSQHNLRYIWTVMRQAEEQNYGLKNTKIRFISKKTANKSNHLSK